MYALQVKYAHGCGMRIGSVPSAGISTKGSLSEVSDNLSIMLTGAPPKQQKKMIAEHLYPLIRQHKVNLFLAFFLSFMILSFSSIIATLCTDAK